MPLFITFEGGEGCGKSTQARILCRRLSQPEHPAVLIHETGGTPVGERIRRLLKQASYFSITPICELMLFNASRNQLVSNVIQPGLRRGKIVICDRFTDSTLAYQHYGRGLDLKLVENVNLIAAQDCQPDVTFLLDIPPEIGLSRKRPDAQDRFEQEDLDFHKRVRMGFLKLAAEAPQRWVVVDAALSKSVIAGIIWEKITDIMEKGH
jgi:dTMP kinase